MCLGLSLRIVHDRSDKAIPTLSEGLNEDGCFRRFTQRLAQSLDGCIQTMIEVDEGVCRPELVAAFGARMAATICLSETFPAAGLEMFPATETIFGHCVNLGDSSTEHRRCSN